jgi:hypothetical protein
MLYAEFLFRHGGERIPRWWVLGTVSFAHQFLLATPSAIALARASASLVLELPWECPVYSQGWKFPEGMLCRKPGATKAQRRLFREKFDREPDPLFFNPESRISRRRSTGRNLENSRAGSRGVWAGIWS